MKTLLRAFIFSFLCAMLAEAQEQKAPPPSGPLLGRIGDFTSWRIYFSYAQNKVPAGGSEAAYTAARSNIYLPAQPRTITLIRTRPLWHATTVDVYGNVLEQCFDGQEEYADSPKWNGAVLCSRERFNTGIMDFNQYDFPDMEWISPQTYVGIEDKGTIQCMVFAKADMMVWVNLETRMPVLWRRGNETRSFQQLPPPTEKISLPPRIARLSESLKIDRARLTLPIPPGG